ncbi:MAG: hypothetical protein KA116_11780 [Proteobacteria bacterium]|nr:hypothetical protein [Pseudomonadota bacterium]
MSTQYSSRKRGQALLSAVMVSGMGIAVLTALVSYIIKSNEDKIAMMNEADAKFLNEMSFARVGQAISETAILCSELKNKCVWNSDTQQAFTKDQFGFDDWTNSGTKAQFKVLNCLPTRNDVVEGSGTVANPSLTKCEKYNSSIQLEMMSIQDAMDSEILKKDSSGATASSTDNDNYVVAIRVETKFISGSNGKEQSFVSSALIRRPRSFVSIIPGRAQCKPTCPIPNGQTREEAMCYGPIGLIVGATNLALVSNFQIRNDGPGYLYRSGLKRIFIKNPALVADTGISAASANPTNIPIIDSGTGEDAELAPGREQTFTDNIECAHETLVHNHEVVTTSNVSQTITHAGFDGVATSSDTSYGQTTYQSTFTPNGEKPTGNAVYTVDAAKIVPNNFLQLDSEGATIPSTQTDIDVTVHKHITTTTITYLGQN